MSKLATGDKIGIIGLVIAVLAIVAGTLIPEIREALGLEEAKAQQETPNKTDTLPEKGTASRKLPGSKPPGKTHQPATVTLTDTTKSDAYRGIVVDSTQHPLAGVRVTCASCETQQAVTDAAGAFLLRKQYPENNGFRQVSVNFSKGTKTITLQLDWRERETIIF